MLWSMEGDMARLYCNSWTTCRKLTWDVSRATRTYFLDYLSGGLISVRRDILGRYAGFSACQLSSPCKVVNILARVVAKDIRRTTAKNLRLLDIETGGLTWVASSKKIKEELESREQKVAVKDGWRLSNLGKLLEDWDRLIYQGEEDSQEVVRLQGLMDSLCASWVS